MSLRKRIFLHVLAVSLILSLVMSFSSNYLAMRAFRRVECRFFEQDMARVQTGLDEALRLVGRYARDWGAWDDMYFFMEDRDLSRFELMLNGEALSALDLDILVVLDAEPGPPLVSYTIGERGEERGLSTPSLDDLTAMTPDLLKKALQEPFETILSLGGDLYIAGVSPILMTNRAGPARGLVLTGTRFEKERAKLTASLRTDFDLLPAGRKAVPSRSSGEVSVQPAPDGTAFVRQTRETMAGTAPLMIDIRAPRPIYHEGQRAVAKSYLWIFASGAAILAVVMVLLNHLVLRRLDGLRSVSDQIVERGAIGLRVPVTGDDEITTLSSSFNTLLDTLESLVADLPDPLIVTDLEGQILIANVSAHAALGLQGEGDLAGRALSSVLQEELPEGDPIGTSLSDSPIDMTFSDRNVFEAEFIRADGTASPVEIHRSEILFGKCPLVLLLARDLSERKNFERHLAHRAYHDDLTGLPNRYAFIEDLDRALRESQETGRTYYTAVINMDRFKLINSQVGFSNGDKILILVSQRLQEALGEGLHPYRTGGDEFSLLVPVPPHESPRTQAESLMEEIRRAIGAPCSVGDETLFPSASIGVFLDISSSISSSEVMSETMVALGEAQKEGIGLTSYLDGKGESVDLKINILLLNAEMRIALEKEEFLPFFQPIHSIDSREIIGFETLARWNHPIRGLLPPSEFIPAAEQTGFIGPIDPFMMKRALKLIGLLTRDNPRSELFFSANGSTSFFKDLKASEITEGIFNKAGGDPSHLVMEVTESLLIEDLRGISRKIQELKDQGIKIALDDFGTGYSSTSCPLTTSRSTGLSWEGSLSLKKMSDC